MCKSPKVPNPGLFWQVFNAQRLIFTDLSNFELETTFVRETQETDEAETRANISYLFLRVRGLKACDDVCEESRFLVVCWLSIVLLALQELFSV